MQFKSLLCFASFATLTLSANVDDIIRNIALIGVEASSLNGNLTSLPTLPSIGQFATILTIHSTAIAAITILDTTAEDAQTVPTPVSVDDGTRVLNAINSIKGEVESALSALTAKRGLLLGFFGLIPGVSALNPARQDLLNLNSSVTRLGAILVSLAPQELQSQANATSTELLGAFASAIATFG